MSTLAHRLALVLGVLAVVASAACGGNSNPAKSSVTATAVTFGNSSEFMKVGERIAFSATASHSDGSSAAVTEWSSDTPSVATVDAGGSVSGVSAGQANIIARHDGVQAVKLVRVVPDYQGTWSGYYHINGCQASGDYEAFGWCGQMNGQRPPISISLSQNRDTVTGTLAFKDFTGAVSGPIAMDGTIRLSGTMVSGSNSITILNWVTNARSAGSMSGTFDQRITGSGISGQATHQCDVSGLSKSSSFTVGLTPPADASGLPSTPRDILRSLGIR